VFWLQGCGTFAFTVCARIIFTALRNRYNFLMNFTGLLRNKSVCMSELSDCRHFFVNRERDHDPMFIYLMFIGTGKTIKSNGPSQYGRAIRHRDVFQCSVGAFGFYLLYRFLVNGEFVDLDHVPDFRENSSWFDMKVLTEYGGDSNKQMDQRTFRDAVKKVFKELGISAKHFGHWGRVAGSVFGEFHELPPDVIQLLGKFVLLCVVFSIVLI
jgi:Centromere DNA-binding protein complex CBF3 subunit, domain 2